VYRLGDVDGLPVSGYRSVYGHDGAASGGGSMGMTQQTPLTVRQWRRAEYERLVDLGVFRGEPIELIGGQLVVAEPQGAYHASAISAAEYTLRAVLPPGWIVRTQLPVSLDEESEPEPDLVVVPGRPADYRGTHPARPALAVEVAESSLEFDREQKGSLYARAGIPEYWIVNLVDRIVEVYREPEPDPTAGYGWRYRSLTSLTSPAVVAPLAFASSRIAVADLLP
jgi:Uma2 family endonuclease